MTTQAEQEAEQARKRADAVALIAETREDRDEAHTRRNRDLARWIGEAREAGATWPMIAEAMSMTPNGVRHFIRSHG